MKLRVYHMPQVGCGCPMFHVPVSSVEEGKKMLDVLSVYDLYQLENNIKPDYSSMNGLEMFDEEEQEWISWEDEESCTDDVDEYLENDEKIKLFSKEVFGQLKGNF